MESKYKGMTVNERLYVSGLINEFYEAVQQKDVKKVIAILRAVDLDNESIKANLKFDNLESDEI